MIENNTQKYLLLDDKNKQSNTNIYIHWETKGCNQESKIWTLRLEQKRETKENKRIKKRMWIILHFLCTLDDTAVYTCTAAERNSTSRNWVERINEIEQMKTITRTHGMGSTMDVMQQKEFLQNDLNIKSFNRIYQLWKTWYSLIVFWIENIGEIFLKVLSYWRTQVTTKLADLERK